jgi:hypothetical protein
VIDKFEIIYLSALEIMKIYEAEKNGEPNEALRLIGEGIKNTDLTSQG